MLDNQNDATAEAPSAADAPLPAGLLPTLLTEDQVASYLGVCREVLARERRAGAIEHIIISKGVIRYTPDHVTTYVQNRASGGKKWRGRARSNPRTLSATSGSNSAEVSGTAADTAQSGNSTSALRLARASLSAQK